jgi:hypothetical protein
LKPVLVSFPELEHPDEWIFHLGIAYPTHATIDQTQKPMIRYCHFSTGDFVEPVTHWEEPYLLQFDVTDNPLPMQELSLYEIHPPHLKDYFRSQKGEFRLIKVSREQTKLVGTTWYSLDYHPTWYWRIWCDYIIHKIHWRVLKHIKIITENE